MAGIRFGVISYLPNDERVRTVRWKTTKKCLENLLEVSSWVKKPLRIARTNWRNLEHVELMEMVEKNHTPLVLHEIPMEHRGAAVSRNALLKDFYNSDDDFLMLCDDDATIYPYYEIEKFLRDLDENPRKYIEMGLRHICAKLGNSSPFKEANMQDLDFAKNWVFKAGGDHAGRCPQIFANFKKYLGKEIYQREYLYNELKIGGEDEMFNLDLMQEGVMIYTLTSFIAGTTEITSSFWDEKKSKKDMLKDSVWEEGQPTLDYIMKCYPKAKQITKYRLDTSAYRPKHKDRILVPRKDAYVYTAWDIPVKRAKKQRKGGLLGK